MRTTVTILITVALSMLFHHPSSAQDHSVPFTATAPFYFSSRPQPVKIPGFSSSIANNKIVLAWTVTENQDAVQFEVQKSNNGKKFVMTALVFGTGKTDTDNYRFFEKARAAKTFYRIKAITKDNSIKYSEIITA